jgi:hypothetical protein
MRATRHPLAAIACLLLLAGVVGCGGESPGTATPSTAGPPGSTAPAATETQPLATEPPPSESTAVPPSETPAETAGPPPSDAASPSPAGRGSAADCSGTDNNRDFFADAANALDFDVYCPVLPRGWFVETGEYQLRNGGLLRISYRGPGGTGIDLLERGPCEAGDDCMPSGTEEGEASIGSRPATVIALDDGGLMVVAQATGEGIWSVTGTGLDEAALTRIAADLVLVDG